MEGESVGRGVYVCVCVGRGEMSLLKLGQQPFCDQLTTVAYSTLAEMMVMFMMVLMFNEGATITYSGGEGGGQ